MGDNEEEQTHAWQERKGNGRQHRDVQCEVKTLEESYQVNARQRRGGCSALFRSSKEGEAQKQGPGRRGELEARRHHAVGKGLLETKEGTPKLRIGAPAENEEALFRDIMVLDDVISEMEKELREAEEALWRVMLELKSITAKERKETDAAGGGDPLASPGLASPGRLAGSICSAGGSQKKRKAVVRKETAETQGYVSCKEMEVENN